MQVFSSRMKWILFSFCFWTTTLAQLFTESRDQLAECRADGHEVLIEPSRKVLDPIPLRINQGTLCDDRLLPGWYRFSLDGNRAEMASECMAANQCGTSAPIWLRAKRNESVLTYDDRPSLPGKYELKIIMACVAVQSDCCAHTVPIQVRNCGEFFVYFLFIPGNVRASVTCSAFCAESRVPAVRNGRDAHVKRSPFIRPRVISTDQRVEGAFRLRCIFEDPVGRGRALYKITWTSSKGGKTQILRTEDTTNIFSETDVINIDVTIACAITVVDRFNPNTILLEESKSEDFYIGLKFEPTVVDLEEGETRRIMVTSSVPFPCDTSDRSGCYMRVFFASRNSDRKNNLPPNVMLSGCSVAISREACHEGICGRGAFEVTGVQDFANDGKRKTIIETRPILTNDAVWTGYEAGNIEVTVIDVPTSQCYSYTDPHIATLDGALYDLHTTGTFVFYRSNERDFEVHARVWDKCDMNSTTTSKPAWCHCGVAVQENGDVIVIDRCGKDTSSLNDITDPDIEIISELPLASGTKITKSHGGKKITIFFPSGAFVRVDVESWGIDLTIQSPSTDKGKTNGLCGDFDGNRGNDVGRKGIEKWRLAAGASLFERIPVKKSPSLEFKQNQCVCGNRGDECLYENPVSRPNLFGGDDVTEYYVTRARQKTVAEEEKISQRSSLPESLPTWQNQEVRPQFTVRQPAGIFYNRNKRSTRLGKRNINLSRRTRRKRSTDYNTYPSQLHNTKRTKRQAYGQYLANQQPYYQQNAPYQHYQPTQNYQQPAAYQPIGTGYQNQWTLSGDTNPPPYDSPGGLYSHKEHQNVYESNSFAQSSAVPSQSSRYQHESVGRGYSTGYSQNPDYGSYAPNFYDPYSYYGQQFYNYNYENNNNQYQNPKYQNFNQKPPESPGQRFGANGQRPNTVFSNSKFNRGQEYSDVQQNGFAIPTKEVVTPVRGTNAGVPVVSDFAARQHNFGQKPKYLNPTQQTQSSQTKYRQNASFNPQSQSSTNGDVIGVTSRRQPKHKRRGASFGSSEIKPQNREISDEPYSHSYSSMNADSNRDVPDMISIYSEQDTRVRNSGYKTHPSYVFMEDRFPKTSLKTIMRWPNRRGWSQKFVTTKCSSIIRKLSIVTTCGNLLGETSIKTAIDICVRDVHDKGDWIWAERTYSMLENMCEEKLIKDTDMWKKERDGSLSPPAKIQSALRCPHNCHNNGRCLANGCLCNTGYNGVDCGVGITAVEVVVLSTTEATTTSRSTESTTTTDVTTVMAHNILPPTTKKQFPVQKSQAKHRRLQGNSVTEEVEVSTTKAATTLRSTEVTTTSDVATVMTSPQTTTQRTKKQPPVLNSNAKHQNLHANTADDISNMTSQTKPSRQVIEPKLVRNSRQPEEAIPSLSATVYERPDIKLSGAANDGECRLSMSVCNRIELFGTGFNQNNPESDLRCIVTKLSGDSELPGLSFPAEIDPDDYSHLYCPLPEIQSVGLTSFAEVKYQVKLTDGGKESNSLQVVILLDYGLRNPCVENKPPFLVKGSEGLKGFEGEFFIYQLQATDPEDPFVSFELDGGSTSGVSLTVTGLVEWRVPYGIKEKNITFIIEDQCGLTTKETIQISIVPCLCENGGQCVPDLNKAAGLGAYECRCPIGFDGKYCNETDDACLPGLTGLHCQHDIDECSQSPCYEGVECFNTIGSFYCGVCPDGYFGKGFACAKVGGTEYSDETIADVSRLGDENFANSVEDIRSLAQGIRESHELARDLAYNVDDYEYGLTGVQDNREDYENETEDEIVIPELKQIMPDDAINHENHENSRSVSDGIHQNRENTTIHANKTSPFHQNIVKSNTPHESPVTTISTHEQIHEDIKSNGPIHETGDRQSSKRVNINNATRDINDHDVNIHGSNHEINHEVHETKFAKIDGIESLPPEYDDDDDDDNDAGSDDLPKEPKTEAPNEARNVKQLNHYNRTLNITETENPILVGSDAAGNTLGYEVSQELPPPGFRNLEEDDDDVSNIPQNSTRSETNAHTDAQPDSVENVVESDEIQELDPPEFRNLEQKDDSDNNILPNTTETEETIESHQSDARNNEVQVLPPPEFRTREEDPPEFRTKEEDVETIIPDVIPIVPDIGNSADTGSAETGEVREMPPPEFRDSAQENNDAIIPDVIETDSNTELTNKSTPIKDANIEPGNIQERIPPRDGSPDSVIIPNITKPEIVNLKEEVDKKKIPPPELRKNEAAVIPPNTTIEFVQKPNATVPTSNKSTAESATKTSRPANTVTVPTTVSESNDGQPTPSSNSDTNKNTSLVKTNEVVVPTISSIVESDPISFEDADHSITQTSEVDISDEDNPIGVGSLGDTKTNKTISKPTATNGTGANTPTTPKAERSILTAPRINTSTPATPGTSPSTSTLPRKNPSTPTTSRILPSTPTTPKTTSTTTTSRTKPTTLTSTTTNGNFSSKTISTTKPTTTSNPTLKANTTTIPKSKSATTRKYNTTATSISTTTNKPTNTSITRLDSTSTKELTAYDGIATPRMNYTTIASKPNTTDADESVAKLWNDFKNLRTRIQSRIISSKISKPNATSSTRKNTSTLAEREKSSATNFTAPITTAPIEPKSASTTTTISTSERVSDTARTTSLPRRESSTESTTTSKPKTKSATTIPKDSQEDAASVEPRAPETNLTTGGLPIAKPTSPPNVPKLVPTETKQPIIVPELVKLDSSRNIKNVTDSTSDVETKPGMQVTTMAEMDDIESTNQPETLRSVESENIQDITNPAPDTNQLVATNHTDLNARNDNLINVTYKPTKPVTTPIHASDSSEPTTVQKIEPATSTPTTLARTNMTTASSTTRDAITTIQTTTTKRAFKHKMHKMMKCRKTKTGKVCVPVYRRMRYKPKLKHDLMIGGRPFKYYISRRNGRIKYSQKDCQKRCGNKGICNPNGMCKCKPQYAGQFCERSACDNMCKNKGICVSRNNCKCVGGYFGVLCEKFKCENPCQNGGNCIGPNTCHCTKSFTGQTCETPVCEPRCGNGGKCETGNKCSCLDGYVGDRCEKATCTPGCQNGGICVMKNVCFCPKLHIGSRCQISVCSPRCEHGGRCMKNNKCLCKSGWNGDHCTSPVCIEQCANGGVCVAPNKCKCKSGWSGSTCKTGHCRRCRFGSRCVRPNVCKCPFGVRGRMCRVRTRYSMRSAASFGRF